MIAIDPANRPNGVISGNSVTSVIFNMNKAEQLVVFFGNSDRYLGRPRMGVHRPGVARG